MSEKGDTRGWALVSMELRFWLALSLCFHMFMWVYTGQKSAHWRKLHASGQMYVDGLHPGWFFGLPQDLSDPQWRMLRKFLPLIALGIPVHAALSRGSKRLETSLPGARMYFYCATNIGFVVFLHGGKAIWPVSIAAVSYCIGRLFQGSKWNPVLTWAFCLAMLIASDYYRGFQHWRWWGTPLGFLETWGNGVYAWQTQFNLTMLRLVSFNIERYWANCPSRSSVDRGDEEEEGGGACAERSGVVVMSTRGGHSGHTGGRVGCKIGARRDQGVQRTCDKDYSLVHLVSYVFYIPLYIAGPIMTFPSWLAGSRQPQSTMTPSQARITLFPSPPVPLSPFSPRPHPPPSRLFLSL